MQELMERHRNAIAGKLECLDRVIVTGTLPRVCHAQGMTSILFEANVPIFKYMDYVKPFRDRIVDNAEKIARDAGLEIEFIRRNDFRKEDRIAEILKTRGHHPGLVHVFSAIENCTSYRPWHDKTTHNNYLKPDSGKCKHYYFYFIDEQFGLCYLRVPTWCPFRLQFYFNGHNWLARELDRHGIRYQQVDNAFVQCDDWQAAGRLADSLDPKELHRTLDRYAAQCCPVFKDFNQRYHWSLSQVEYATDLVFRGKKDLAPLYEGITRTAIHAVKADDVATFLGRKLHPLYEGEVGGRYQTRIEGTRIKHQMGHQVSIKMYDKLGHVLRVETTVNDVGFFKTYREVAHRDGTSSMKQAPVQKTIYSLPVLRELCQASNRRYMEFVSQIEDPGPQLKQVRKVAEPVRENDRSVPGFNLLREGDQNLFLAILRGEFNISGMTNRALRRVLGAFSGPQMSRLLKRLRLHGIIKRAGPCYKYYLTRLGRAVVTAALKLRECVILPALAPAPTG